MRLVLEVTSEQQAGVKFWLRSRQSVIVGRTSDAEFAFPGDRVMSRMHFTITCDGSNCTLLDLGSKNGTAVNGALVTRCLLRDGDEIAAGETFFVVHLEGAELPPDPVNDLPSAASDGVVTAPTRNVPRRIGSWVIPDVPDGWETDTGHGICFKDSIFPTTLAVNEGPLPERVKLRDYLELLTTKLTESNRIEDVNGPTGMAVAGADEAWETVIRHAPSGGVRLVQRQLYVCHDQTMGVATFLTTSDQWNQRQGDFDRIIRGLIFRSSHPDRGQPLDPSAGDNTTKTVRVS